MILVSVMAARRVGWCRDAASVTILVCDLHVADVLLPHLA
jgi:hypothetical protein